jgi:predicted RNA-binding protein Jag
MAHMGDVFEGRTLDAAVKMGLETLGLSRAEAKIETIQEGSGGFLGIGARSWRVRVMRRPGGPPPVDQDRDERRPRGSGRDRRERDRDRGGRGGRPREAGRAEGREPARERGEGRRRDERRGAPAGGEAGRPEERRGERRDERAPERRGPRPESAAPGGGRPGEPRERDRDRGGRPREERREGRRGMEEAVGRGPAPVGREETRQREEAPPAMEPRRPGLEGPPAGDDEGGEGRRRRRRGRRGGRRRHGAPGENGVVGPAPGGWPGESAGAPADTTPPPVQSARVTPEESASFATAMGERSGVSVGPAAEPPAGGSPPPRVPREPRTEADETPGLSGEELVAQSVRMTQELLTAMGFEAKVSATVDGSHVDVTAEVARDEELLTGRKGEVRQALQHILNRRLNRGETSRYHLQLEINDFWKRREEELRGLAHSLAEEALATGGEAVTEYLNAQERRIVHVTLRDDTRVKTYALGTGMIKRVAIAPAGFEGGPRDEED